MPEPITRTQSSFQSDQHLASHRRIVWWLYVVATILAVIVLALPDARKDLVSLLSTGAIFATFGSAIGTVGSLWERDLLERIRLNVDILYKDILHQDRPWRRWPFLPRNGMRFLLDGSTHVSTLRNPQIPLDVGTHVIKIDLPTVLEDYFDLPLFQNLQPLRQFQASAGTVYGRRKKDEKNPHTGLERNDEYMAFECMLDIWERILLFRAARYMTYFGSGLTIAGAAITVVYVTVRAV